jgi:hypothetical protein
MEKVEYVPRLNIHTAKTLTCGAPWGVACSTYVSGYGRRWEAWRCQILRGASFALVWCRREEWGANASKAGNILVIQVIVTIVFGKEKKFICGCSEHSFIATHLLGYTGAWLVEEWMPSG